VDGDAERLDGRRQPLDQLHRVQARAVRGPAAGDGARDPYPLGGLARAEQQAVLLAEGELDGVVRLQTRQLRRAVGDFEDAAPVDVGVDAFGLRDPYDLVDGVVHGLLEAYGGVVAVQPGVAVAARDAVVEPAAVAA
jgi:hypothetical protein